MAQSLSITFRQHELIIVHGYFRQNSKILINEIVNVLYHYYQFPHDSEIILCNKYIIGKPLSSGKLCNYFNAININTYKEVTIKRESISSRHPTLPYEYKIHRILFGNIGIPTLYYFGRDGPFNCMVQQKVGPNLEHLFTFSKRKFTLKTVLMLADSMLNIIQYVHSKNFIHRCLSPYSFCIGFVDINKLYITRFDGAKRYKDPRTHRHIQYIEDVAEYLYGDPECWSINKHLGIQQSRRDDLESLGYVLIYFLSGDLPWKGRDSNTMKELKRSISIQILCKGLAKEFEIYLDYCGSLEFEENPDYDYLRRLFEELFVRKGYKKDCYEWDFSI